MEKINWDRISIEPKYQGYENDGFLKNMPTYVFSDVEPIEK